jgi:HPt (histidine-containing phosphotransfer) domain-containing protein
MIKKRPEDIQVATFPTHQVITQANPLRRAMRRIDDQAKDAAGDDPVARADQALASLSGEFGQWMIEEADRLAAAHEALLRDGITKDTRADLFRAAHDIKGDAATFGFPAAAATAESLCRIVEHAPDLAKVPNELIANHVAAIQAIVREGADGQKFEVQRALNRRLRNVADEFLASVNRDRPEHLEAILAPSIAPSE